MKYPDDVFYGSYILDDGTYPGTKELLFQERDEPLLKALREAFLSRKREFAAFSVTIPYPDCPGEEEIILYEGLPLLRKRFYWAQTAGMKVEYTLHCLGAEK